MANNLTIGSGVQRIDKMFVGEDSASKAYCGSNQVWRSYWTPAEISTELWVDSNDPNSYGLDDDGGIAEYWDKSGNGHSLDQWDANRRPTIDPSTKDGIVFSGVDLLYCDVDMTGQSSFAIFAALKADSQAAAQSVFRQQNSSYFVFPWTQAGAIAPKTIMSWDGGTGSSYTNGTLTSYCTTAFTRKEAGNSYNKTYLDGAEVASAAMNTSSFSGGSGSCYVGSFFGDEFFSGKLRELILYFGEISVANRQKVEGYLAWKWGTEASLPSGHPYEDSAP